MILDLVLISFLFQKPALPNKLTSIDMYLLLSINSANYAFVLNLCKAQAPFHGQEAVAGCHTRLCSAIVIQCDLESWVYDCPQPHGGGEETDGGERERERARAAIPFSLHLAPLFPLRTLVNIVWLKSILHSLVSFPPLRGINKQKPIRTHGSWFIFAISVYLLMRFFACGQKATGNEELCIKKHSGIEKPPVCSTFWTVRVELDYA